MRFDQCLARLLPPLRDKKFGAPGKKKRRTDSETRQENADLFQSMKFVDEGSDARHRGRLKPTS